MDDKDKSKEAKKRKIIDGKSVRIEKVFVGEQMVTRSKKRYLDSFGICECFVALRPNFQALCLQWLNESDPRNQQVTENLQQPQQKKVQRRASVSAASLFHVDGEVQELAVDYLHRLPRDSRVILGNPVEPIEPPTAQEIEEVDPMLLNRLQSYLRIGSMSRNANINPNDKHENGESAPKNLCNAEPSASNQNEAGENIDDGIVDHNDGSKSSQPLTNVQSGRSLSTNAMDIFDASNNIITGAFVSNGVVNLNEAGTNGLEEPQLLQPSRQPNVNLNQNSQWNPGPTIIFDPFRRTRNIPFAITGRRRSINVMTTVTETDNEFDA